MLAIEITAITTMLICIIISSILFYIYNKETSEMYKYKQCRCCRVWNTPIGSTIGYEAMREYLKDMYKYEFVSFAEYRRIDARLARTIWRLKYKEAKNETRTTNSD